MVRYTQPILSQVALNQEKSLRVNTFLSKDSFVTLMRIKLALLIKYSSLAELFFIGLVLLLFVTAWTNKGLFTYEWWSEHVCKFKNFGKCFSFSKKSKMPCLCEIMQHPIEVGASEMDGHECVFYHPGKGAQLHMCYRQTRTTTTTTGSRPRQEIDFSEGNKWVQMSVTH